MKSSSERDEYEEILRQLVAIEVHHLQINARLETRLDQHAQVLERHETLLARTDEMLAAIRALLERLLHPPANGY